RTMPSTKLPKPMPSSSAAHCAFRCRTRVAIEMFPRVAFMADAESDKRLPHLRSRGYASQTDRDGKARHDLAPVQHVTHADAFADSAPFSAPCLGLGPVHLPLPRIGAWSIGACLGQAARGVIREGVPCLPGAGAFAHSPSSVTRGAGQRRLQGCSRLPLPE